jgi:hypothetical protein
MKCDHAEDLLEEITSPTTDLIRRSFGGLIAIRT